MAAPITIQQYALKLGKVYKEITDDDLKKKLEAIPITYNVSGTQDVPVAKYMGKKNQYFLTAQVSNNIVQSFFLTKLTKKNSGEKKLCSAFHTTIFYLFFGKILNRCTLHDKTLKLIQRLFNIILSLCNENPISIYELLEQPPDENFVGKDDIDEYVPSQEPLRF